ncbi:MAG: hypothetical protein LBE18_00530, partial [Planctomycetaceae bacterium]|nr:hypothetical protein [Planctomycetaceae bacterium]
KLYKKCCMVKSRTFDFCTYFCVAVIKTIIKLHIHRIMNFGDPIAYSGKLAFKLISKPNSSNRKIV